jgi:hypothetical protein
MYPLPPAPFLTPIIHDLSTNPPIAALCAGYESGEWRGKAFADHVMEWLPEFSLSAEELRLFTPGTAVRLIKKAARLVYQTSTYKNRGEFGEIFLHIALRQIYDSIPAISKIYWKDSVNSTVKGFDAVHVVARGGALELWLGEVKFYEDGKKAIADVAVELVNHTKIDYLRNEFMLITNKLDSASQYFEALSLLLDPNTSLDNVFDSVCIPILITYESKAIRGSNKHDGAYMSKIIAEVSELQKKFREKVPPGSLPIKLHLFILPLHTKKVFVQALDNLLKEWQ